MGKLIILIILLFIGSFFFMKLYRFVKSIFTFKESINSQFRAKKKPEDEVVYKKDDIVVLKGDAESNSDNETEK